MHCTIVRYQTKPEATAENAALIEGVFRELAAAAPVDARYAVFRTGDGQFVHLFMHDDPEDDSSITGLPAFEKFVDGGAERRTAPPVRIEMTLVGNYRMLAR